VKIRLIFAEIRFNKVGKKINPKIFRISNPDHPLTWNSKWFSNKANFGQKIQEDYEIRKLIKKKIAAAGIDKTEIYRRGQEVEIMIYVAKPGLVIGRGGAQIEQLKDDVRKLIDKLSSKNKSIKLNLTIKEIAKINLSAACLVEDTKQQIEKRMLFRRVMKKTIDNALKAGALGVKIEMAGRLNGVEISRRERLISGRMPLHTLRADIDYSRDAAHTTYGQIGIKVWVYKGEVFA